MAHLTKPDQSVVLGLLTLVMALTLACGGSSDELDKGASVEATGRPSSTGASVPTDTPVPPTATSAPQATPIVPRPTPTPTPTPAVFTPLQSVSTQSVALSVLIEPLDVGHVEIAGERTLSNGQATEVNRNDQINVIARANDQARWRFDRWGGDLQGRFAAETLVMDSPKKIRAIFVKAETQSPEHTSFYQLKINDQVVRNIALGLENGSVYVSPPPGAGESPYREGTIVTLIAIPGDGYDAASWRGACGGSGPCVLTMNSDKDIQVTFRPSGVSAASTAVPTATSAPVSATPSPTRLTSAPISTPTITPTTSSTPSPIAKPGPFPTPRPVPGKLLRIYKTGSWVESSPAVVNGVIYVGLRDGHMSALAVNTGEQVWQFKTGGKVEATPSIVDGGVYFGSRDGHVYALDTATGIKIWSYDTGDEVVSSPAVGDGVVYAGSFDHRVYALRAATGERIWSHQTDGKVESSPVVSDAVVYVVSNDRSLYALNASTGSRLWRVTAGNYYNNRSISPEVADGVVYWGSNRKLFAMDSASGDTLWKFSELYSGVTSVALVRDTVLVGTAASIVALDKATGKQLWHFSISSYTRGFPSSPVVNQGVVYFGSGDGYLYALDAGTGERFWRFKTEGAVSSTPAVADGVVYVSSGDGRLYAIAAGGR